VILRLPFSFVNSFIPQFLPFSFGVITGMAGSVAVTVRSVDIRARQPPARSLRGA